MAPRLPPLNPLKNFEAVARHMSVNGAAKELGVTSSAVSHQVRSLEHFLGFQLVEWHSGRLTLTPQGVSLLPAISTAFTVIAEAAARVNHPSAASRFVLSCEPAFLLRWLIPRLPEFTERFPDLDLQIVASNSTKDIYASDVDLCVRYGDGNWPDCWVHLLAPVRLFPVISPSLRARRPLDSVQDLKQHILIHCDDGKEWHTWLTANGEANPVRRQHHFPDAHIGLEAAIHGGGVALGDTTTAAGALLNGRLEAPFKSTVPAFDSLFFACRIGMQFTPIVAEFIEWVNQRLSSQT